MFKLSRETEMSNLFDITGGMDQGVPVYTPSWFSPKEIKRQKKLIGVKITETPTQPSKIGVSSIQTTRQYPRLQRTGDSYFQTSTTFRLVVNIIQTEKSHSLLENPNWLSILEISQVLQHSYFQKISMLQLCNSLRILWYYLVLLPTKVPSSSVVQTGSSQAVQHTVIR